ncbi:MAG: hypothetical protein U0793_10710 [Gemmataceae bacterium]
MNTNFGELQGGWVHVQMPELGIDSEIIGYASDTVVSSTQASSPDFAGLAGLALVRLLEYGGNADCFWLKASAKNAPSSTPPAPPAPR